MLKIKVTWIRAVNSDFRYFLIQEKQNGNVVYLTLNPAV